MSAQQSVTQRGYFHSADHCNYLFYHFCQSSWHAYIRRDGPAHRLNCSCAYLCQSRKSEDTVGRHYFHWHAFVNMVIPQNGNERDQKYLIATMRPRWVAASKEPTFSDWALFPNAGNNRGFNWKKICLQIKGTITEISLLLSDSRPPTFKPVPGF